MKIHHLGEENSVLNQFMAQIRDVAVQSDRMRFRKNIERIGEILGYELSKTLKFASHTVTTPLGKKETKLLNSHPVICSVLRAGLALQRGLLNYFDDADNAFISAYRRHKDGGEVFDIVIEYLSSPSLDGRILLLADPMLATGRSLVSAYQAMAQLGVPEEIHLVAVIGASEGIAYVGRHFPENTHLWIAAIDDTLNAKGYIVPGLGDCGDLSYGIKLQH
ncbi:MAG: uracil phosphoribosyltransferase [Sinomicrobium sp.]|nr:uracil phosphoribosyltransferase [Sinomicrobium sp.]